MSVSLPKLRGEWLQCEQSLALMELFASHGHTARFVGGAVRNALLGEPVNDLDVAVDALPQTVMELAQSAGFKAIGTGLSHGTVTVVIGDKTYEVTTLRIDMKTYGRHADVAFTQSWAEDAARRDFTINALYAGADGVVFDPLGGYGDLVARRVRFIGDPRARITEDSLRILRFFRFSAQYGAGEVDGAQEVDAAGLAACVELQQGLRSLSAERIGAELMRLLRMPRAAQVLVIMHAHGLLVPLTGRVPHLTRFQRWLTFEKILGLPLCSVHRLGALFVLISEDADRLAGCLRLSNQEKRRLERWAQRPGAAGFEPSEIAEEKRAHLLFYQLRDEYQISVAIQFLMSQAAADDLTWRNLYELPKRWQAPDFPLKGQDLLDHGMKPGPLLGKKLRKLEQHWISSDFALSAKELLKQLDSR